MQLTVGRSVGRSVGQSVSQSVGQSVSQSVSQSVLALSPSGTHDQILAVVKTVAVFSEDGSVL
jgi:hypothetical protein